MIISSAPQSEVAYLENCKVSIEDINKNQNESIDKELKELDKKYDK